MRCCGRCSGGNGCIRLFNAYALVSRGQLDAAGTVSDGLCCLDGWRVAGASCFSDTVCWEIDDVV